VTRLGAVVAGLLTWEGVREDGCGVCTSARLSIILICLLFE